MMNAQLVSRAVWGVVLGISLCTSGRSFANGGPFVIKYPKGDPAARGILARLDPSLKPAREQRLRVIKEDLKITFVNDRQRKPNQNTSVPPLALVSAEYTIENPTEQEIEIDFGFPILRGIYISPLSMTPRPDVRVRLNNKKDVRVNIISNSAIYGLIRHRAREVIEKAVAQDATLAELVATVRATGMVRQRARRTVKGAVGADAALAAAVAKDPVLASLAARVPDATDVDHEEARAALAKYLAGPMKWNKRDVTLMVAFAGLDFGTMRARPPDQRIMFATAGREFINANLGPLGAIGEQKATQFFAKLASCFDPSVGPAYESIFAAWGGDVRERSVDLKTGDVRPREITIDPNDLGKRHPFNVSPGSDPTIYARVDFLDTNAKISQAERASCKAVLKDLPVIFTFAPMNLLHYRVKFPARATQTLTVSYKQYAYKDTREPASYQLAYVVHPASMWKDFGPINLQVATPGGVPFRASVPCRNTGIEERELDLHPVLPGRKKERIPFAIHLASLTEKTGELFLALDAKAWDRSSREKADERRVQQQASR